MRKNKPRHYPDKPANRMGSYCTYWEEYSDGHGMCEGNRYGGYDKCQGNPHNCCKQRYKAIQLYNKRKGRSTWGNPSKI